MKLRLRLVLTLGAATIPLLLLLVWLREDAARRASANSLRDFMLSFASEDGALQECERAPERWPRPHGPPPHHGPRPPGDRGPPPFGEPPPFGGPPPFGAPPPFGHEPPEGGPPGPHARFFVYGSTLIPATIDSPALDRTFVDAIGSDASARRSTDDGTEVLVRLPWSSEKCAYLLAHAKRPPNHARDLATLLIAPALVAIAFMFVLWLALASVVQRLHRLAAAVANGEPIEAMGNDEIGSVAAALQHANEQVRAHVKTVEAREQALREFLANTTHDVMIPLTVLQGSLAKIDSALAQTAREEAHYIASLLSNLSAVAKLEAGATQIHRGETALEAIVERAVERHQTLAGEKKIELEAVLPGDPVIVDADPTLVEQCVSNLVYNAVRYTPESGHVTVVLDLSGGAFELKVIDDGPGMSDADRQRALDRGFRSQRARRENPDGSGLGLSIAKAVAEQHGWTLTLAAAEPHGLEARITGRVRVA